MRKFTYAFLAVCMILLVACSADKNKKENTDNNKQADEQKVNVDKGLLNVEITLPASLFEGEDIDSVIADVEKEGIKVTKNEDGSLTYKMSKAKHKEMMKEMETSLEESIKEIKESDDYVSIKDITHNKAFSEFTLVVDKKKYEDSMDSFAIFTLGITGMMYQVYSGVDPDDYQVKIWTKDEATKKVLDETIYPDDLEEDSDK
ncbi:hypothetical protein ABW02_22185 [Niallia circulans]|jgi:uncharacterized protein YcfL|uniref:Antigen I/II N-terminal domain-containing protein n=1 Tax=Niallia circulans TaxID=1397 RepID=A0A0J1I7T9_NIACI|nr:hypothetical protein [Niallia circulans]KLV22066.1 hypothetical protein ABW02_22185 [Niallia circulans]MED5099765.1 hypothetical protein [Niallia circulans]PAD23859.1 hypothetical protein CHH62_20210 [Niallia circulans]